MLRWAAGGIGKQLPLLRETGHEVYPVSLTGMGDRGDPIDVVELAYFRGLTCRQIAETEAIPEGTVKSRLRLAMNKLEAVLDRHLLESS